MIVVRTHPHGIHLSRQHSKIKTQCNIVCMCVCVLIPSYLFYRSTSSSYLHSVHPSIGTLLQEIIIPILLYYLQYYVFIWCRSIRFFIFFVWRFHLLYSNVHLRCMATILFMPSINGWLARLTQLFYSRWNVGVWKWRIAVRDRVCEFSLIFDFFSFKSRILARMLDVV